MIFMSSVQQEWNVWKIEKSFYFFTAIFDLQNCIKINFVLRLPMTRTDTDIYGLILICSFIMFWRNKQ